MGISDKSTGFLALGELLVGDNASFSLSAARWLIAIGEGGVGEVGFGLMRPGGRGVDGGFPLALALLTMPVYGMGLVVDVVVGTRREGRPEAVCRGLNLEVSVSSFALDWCQAVSANNTASDAVLSPNPVSMFVVLPAGARCLLGDAVGVVFKSGLPHRCQIQPFVVPAPGLLL